MSKILIDIAWQWRHSREKIEALPKKWRIAILLVGLLLIYFFWNWIFMGSLSNKIQLLKTKKTQTETQIIILQTKQRQMTEEIKKFESSIAMQETLKNQLQQSADVVDISSGQIVSLEQMANVLKVLLSDAGLSLETLDIEPKQSFSPGEITMAEGEDTIYHKTISVTFRGGYFGVLNYLRQLESLNWGLFWSDLDYKVTKYPEADISLKLHIVNF